MEVGRQKRSGAHTDPELLEYWSQYLDICEQTHPPRFQTIEAHAFCARTHIGEGVFRVATIEEVTLTSLTISSLQHRMAQMLKEVLDDKGVPHIWPTAPSMHVPSRFGFYVWGPRGIFMFQKFHATFAAKRFVDIIIDGNDYKWLDTKTIITSHGYKIKSEFHCSLEDVMEYEYKNNQANFEFPVPYKGLYEKFANIASSPQRTRDTDNDTPKPQRAPSQPRPDGLISIGEIAEDLGIEPKDARIALRKSNTEKPAWGWAWPAAQVDKIKRIIKGK